MTTRWIPRISAALTGLCLGLGVGILVTEGHYWPVIALPVLAALLWGAVRLLVPLEDRRAVGAVIALSFALHIAVAAVLFTGSVAAGRGGFIPGDDREYFELSSNFVRYLQGHVQPPWIPPYWAGEAYLFGTWVYLESAIFFLVGPEVLVPILLNGAFALMTALLVFDIARTLFDRRSAFIALALTAFYPSLVLWSSLNLKDALALLLLGICLWALVRFQRHPRWWPLVVAFAAVILMESLRQYLFVGLSLLIPVVVLVTPRMGYLARARWTAPALIVSGLLILATRSGVGLGPQLLATFEGERYAMGIGARTRFVEAPPVLVQEGDTFVVATPAAVPATTTPVPSAAGATSPPTPASPSPTPHVVYVAPNTRIVVAAAPPAAASADIAYVRPGDVVVVGRPGTAPAPVAQRRVMPAAASGGVTLAPVRQSGSELALGTVRHLPVGLAFSLFGPFPWLFDRGLDFLLLPEQVVWYACLLALALTLIRERKRLQVLLPISLLVIGLLGLFALVEGNWGTLFRHRAMVIPWVITLAAPSIAAIRTRRSPPPIDR